MRRLLSLALRADGCEVVEATGLGDLLDRLFHGDADVDVIVAHGRGPIAKGFEVVVALRHVGSDMPVVVIREPVDLDELGRQVRSLDAA